MFDLRGGIETVLHPLPLRVGSGGGDRDDIRIDYRFPEHAESPASSGSCTSSTRSWTWGDDKSPCHDGRHDQLDRSAASPLARSVLDRQVYGRGHYNYAICP
jgi:hypothetical protein